MSPVLPAQCLRCGHRFQPATDGIRIVGPSAGVIVGNNLTTCPLPGCGGSARMLEGTLNVRDDQIELTSGPPWSYGLIESLRLHLRKIVDDNPLDPIAAVREQVNAELAEHIAAAVTAGLLAAGKPASQRRRKQLARKVLVGLLAIVGFSYSDAAGNVAAVAAQAHQLFQYVAAHGDVPDLPEPR